MSSESSEGQVLTTWTVHLVKKSARLQVLFFGGLILSMGILWWLTHSIGWMLLGIIAVLGSLSLYYLPITYYLTDREVLMRTYVNSQIKLWGNFSHYVEYDDAVQLIFHQDNFRGQMLQGLLLYFSNNRDEIMEVVSSKLPPSSEIP